MLSFSSIGHEKAEDDAGAYESETDVESVEERDRRNADYDFARLHFPPP